MTESPLGRRNGGPRRPRRKSRGCAWVLLAGLASLALSAIEIVRAVA